MNEADGHGLINLHVVWLAILRQLVPISFSVAIIVGLTNLAYFLITPVYTATAQVALDRDIRDTLRVGIDNGTTKIDSPAVDTEVQVLTSPELADQVVDRLQLDRRPGFGIKDAGDKPSANSHRRASDALRAGLTVKRAGTSYAITVSYNASDPKVAAEVVNALVDTYVQNQKTGKVNERGDEVRQLRERMGKLRDEVIAAETAVAQYRAATNLINVTGDTATVQQSLSVLNTQLAQAKAEQAAAEARVGAGSGIQQNPVANQLLTRQAQLRAERSEMAGRYGEMHPALAAVDSQLSQIEASLATEQNRIRSGMLAEASVARRRTASIQGSIARAEGEMLAGNKASVRLAELERNADSARQVYQSFLDRYRGELATQGSERSNSYVIARATPPNSPTWPSGSAFFLGGLLAALGVAALVTLVLEFLEKGYRSRSEMESGLGLRTLGSIPDLRTLKEQPLTSTVPLHAADYLVENEESLFTEAFRSIRTTLRLGNAGKFPRSVAITSSIAEEGKTTTAICLARSAALSGLKAVLVDCDIRRRASSRSLVGMTEVGLVDILKGDATLEQVMVQDSTSGAYVLPQRDAKGTDYDLISSDAMSALVKRLQSDFDLVILDTAPILPVAESRAVCALAEATLLVVRWRKTPAVAAEMALRDLKAASANVIGGVLTMVDVRVRAKLGDEVYYYERYAAEPA